MSVHDLFRNWHRIRCLEQEPGGAGASARDTPENSDALEATPRRLPAIIRKAPGDAACRPVVPIRNRAEEPFHPKRAVDAGSVQIMKPTGRRSGSLAAAVERTLDDPGQINAPEYPMTNRLPERMGACLSNLQALSVLGNRQRSAVFHGAQDLTNVAAQFHSKLLGPVPRNVAPQDVGSGSRGRHGLANRTG